MSDEYRDEYENSEVRFSGVSYEEYEEMRLAEDYGYDDEFYDEDDDSRDDDW